jgi:hypothetical protein
MCIFILIYAYTTYHEATPYRNWYTYSLSWNHPKSWFIHILFIMTPHLIVIYAHSLYRETTPNHDLYTYSLSVGVNTALEYENIHYVRNDIIIVYSLHQHSMFKIFLIFRDHLKMYKQQYRSHLPKPDYTINR